MRTRFALAGAVIVSATMVFGALSGPALANAKLPHRPTHFKAKTAQVPNDEKAAANVLLSLYVSGKIHTSERSYKPATSDTAARFVHCSFCGRLKARGFNQLRDSFSLPHVDLRLGSRDDAIVYGYYYYQEFNPDTNTFVNGGSFSGAGRWDGSPLPFYKYDNGVPEALSTVSVGINNPHKPQVPADPCGEGCGQK